MTLERRTPLPGSEQVAKIVDDILASRDWKPDLYCWAQGYAAGLRAARMADALTRGEGE